MNLSGQGTQLSYYRLILWMQEITDEELKAADTKQLTAKLGNLIKKLHPDTGGSNELFVQLFPYQDQIRHNIDDLIKLYKSGKLSGQNVKVDLGHINAADAVQLLEFATSCQFTIPLHNGYPSGQLVVKFHVNKVTNK